MMRTFFSSLFLIVGVVIGRGAVGHGFAVRHVHAALDHFPVDPDMAGMLYVVWYFVSGCMFVFGASIVWIWVRLRAGEDAPLFVSHLIGALYAGIGIFGLIFRHGDPFMGFFLLLGALLLLSGAIIGRGART